MTPATRLSRPPTIQTELSQYTVGTTPVLSDLLSRNGDTQRLCPCPLYRVDQRVGVGVNYR
jgi:hypothetical protein